MIGTSIYYSKRGRSESPTNGGDLITKPNVRNEMIEIELKLFKKEIEEKFAKSDVNKNYIFPRINDDSE
jgi:hypothetical protein